MSPSPGRRPCLVSIVELLYAYMDDMERRFGSDITASSDPDRRDGATTACSGWLVDYVADAATRHAASVAVYGVGLSGLDLVEQMLAATARIPLDRLAACHLTEMDWPRLSNAVSLLSQAQVLVDDHHATRQDALECALEASIEVGAVVIDGDVLAVVNPVTARRTIVSGRLGTSADYCPSWCGDRPVDDSAVEWATPVDRALVQAALGNGFDASGLDHRFSERYSRLRVEMESRREALAEEWGQ